MFGSSLHHNLADHRATSVKDVIPVILEQLGSFIHGTIDHAIAEAVEVLWNQLGKKSGSVGCNLRGLYSHV